MAGSWGSTGTTVATGKQSASSILFARPGSATVRQWEVVETSEVRGLTETAAKDAVPDTAAETTNIDNTTQTQYWASIGGRTYSITATTGTKTERGAARKDESGQWVRTDTVKTYFATGLDPSIWGTTELDADGNAISLSSTGDEPKTISVDRSVSRIAWGVFQTVATTVKEIRHIDTEEHASSIVSANTSALSTTATVYRYTNISSSGTPQYVISAWVSYTDGTEKFAMARYCGASEGWTVTVTQKDYGWSSPNASSSGEGWSALRS